MQMKISGYVAKKLSFNILSQNALRVFLKRFKDLLGLKNHGGQMIEKGKFYTNLRARVL